MKPQSYKRITAYVLDIIIVTLISTLLTLNIYDNKSYQDQTNEYVSLINDYTNKKIGEQEFKLKTDDLVYNINKDTIVITIVNVVITTFYFVVVPYFMNGQTFGKKLMRLKVISYNNNLTMNSFLIRSLFINSILMNILSIIFLLFMKKEMYIKYNNIITYLFGGIILVSFIMILFRDDGRGLHDLLGDTKVINIDEKIYDIVDKETKNNEEKEKLKDIEIIGKKLKM